MPDAAKPHLLDTTERRRLAVVETEGWHRWGPYLSERQWGTVREDYSPDGKAWGYLPHDHARSRAYRWARTGSAASATTGSFGAWRWLSGTGETRS